MSLFLKKRLISLSILLKSACVISFSSSWIILWTIQVYARDFDKLQPQPSTTIAPPPEDLPFDRSTAPKTNKTLKECDKKVFWSNGASVGLGKSDLILKGDEEDIEFDNKLTVPIARIFTLYREACGTYDEAWQYEGGAEFANIRTSDNEIKTPIEWKVSAHVKRYNFSAPRKTDCTKGLCPRISPLVGGEVSTNYVISLPDTNMEYTSDADAQGNTTNFSFYKYTTFWLSYGASISMIGWPAAVTVSPMLAWALNIKAEKSGSMQSQTPQNASRIGLSVRYHPVTHTYLDFSWESTKYFKKTHITNRYYGLSVGFYF